jgi:photosynthetic reaction center cytochrome c subunit
MRLFALSLASLLIVTFTLAISAQEKEGKKGPNPFTGTYKNLKILKPAQVQPVMMAIRTGFGQACTYCHVAGDWGDDSNPKHATALMMMSMTDDINAKFSDGKRHVNCYTCHRGEVTPLMGAPAAAGADAPAR